MPYKVLQALHKTRKIIFIFLMWASQKVHLLILISPSSAISAFQELPKLNLNFSTCGNVVTQPGQSILAKLAKGRESGDVHNCASIISGEVMK